MWDYNTSQNYLLQLRMIWEFVTDRFGLIFLSYHHLHFVLQIIHTNWHVIFFYVLWYCKNLYFLNFRLEMAVLKKCGRTRALMAVPYFVLSKSAFFAIVLTIKLCGYPFTPQVVFMTATFFHGMHIAVSRRIPNAVISLSEGQISIARIQVT